MTCTSEVIGPRWRTGGAVHTGDPGSGRGEGDRPNLTARQATVAQQMYDEKSADGKRRYTPSPKSPKSSTSPARRSTAISNHPARSSLDRRNTSSLKCKVMGPGGGPGTVTSTVRRHAPRVLAGGADRVVEAKANEHAFQARVRTVLRGSCSNHYRRMLPPGVRLPQHRLPAGDAGVGAAGPLCRCGRPRSSPACASG